MNAQLRPILKHRLWMTVWKWDPLYSLSLTFFSEIVFRVKLLCITRDIPKPFLQIKVHPKDRDVLRLLWYQWKPWFKDNYRESIHKSDFWVRTWSLHFWGRHVRDTWVSILKSFPLPPMSCGTILMRIMSSQVEITEMSWLSSKRRPQGIWEKVAFTFTYGTVIE